MLWCKVANPFSVLTTISVTFLELDFGSFSLFKFYFSSKVDEENCSWNQPALSNEDKVSC